MSEQQKPLHHTTVKARQGGAVGVKDMFFEGVHRLTVATESPHTVNVVADAYLDGDECAAVARALLASDEPSHIVVPRAALAALLRLIPDLLSACETSGDEFAMDGFVLGVIDDIAAAHAAYQAALGEGGTDADA